MISSSSHPSQVERGEKFKGDPGFSLVVGFDYYDGPEDGLGVFPSGVGMRFVAVGESRTRRFRAFLLDLLEGDWGARVRSLPDCKDVASTVRVIAPLNSSPACESLQNDLKATPVKVHLIGIARLDFSWISWIPVSTADYTAIREQSQVEDGYQIVHALLKASGAESIDV
ncbi:hypothetical protein [Usitatibacter rugosus]|uniref:hypothetical protein n=1 Tax=Usitatibacter rugosus TaxID=2732067 RepID=UPI001487E66D|nr:hypothetical protein [Usitatibacter rugosus]